MIDLSKHSLSWRDLDLRDLIQELQFLNCERPDYYVQWLGLRNLGEAWDVVAEELDSIEGCSDYYVDALLPEYAYDLEEVIIRWVRHMPPGETDWFLWSALNYWREIQPSIVKKAVVRLVNTFNWQVDDCLSIENPRHWLGAVTKVILHEIQTRQEPFFGGDAGDLIQEQLSRSNLDPNFGKGKLMKTFLAKLQFERHCMDLEQKIQGKERISYETLD